MTQNNAIINLLKRLYQFLASANKASYKGNEIILGLFFLFLPLTHLAAEPLQYGPTRSGETLWKIAQANLPDRSVSIEQYAYAIYLDNPDAFQSRNINQLIRGVKIKLPEIKKVVAISKSQAKKQISILQSNAKQLATAKINSRRFQQQLKKYSKQLKRYRRNSRAWKRTYRKLSRSKRNLAIARNKIARINNILQDNVSKGLSIQSAQLAGSTSSNVATANKNQGKTHKVSANNRSGAPQQEPKNTQHDRNGTPTSEKQSGTRHNSKTGNSDNNATRIHRTEETTRLANQNPDKSAPHQNQMESSSNKVTLNWLAYLKQNMVFIAGIINAIILLFVLFKLFEKKDETE